MELHHVAIIDAGTVVACLALLVRYGRLSHFHPMVVFLAFHLYCITWRLLGLLGSSETLFSQAMWAQGMRPVTDDEIVFATLLSDALLVCMSLGCIAGIHVSLKRRASQVAPSSRISRRVVNLVAFVFGGLGLVALIGLARLPGTEGLTPADELLGDWATSSYLQVAQSWPGLCLVALTYVYGFRRSLVVAVALYLAIMAYQGFHRYRVLLLVIMLSQIRVEWLQRRWPSFGLCLVLAGTVLIFHPMKYIGQMLQAGDPVEAILEKSLDITAAAVRGEADDQYILDMAAAFVSEARREDYVAWGAPYLAVLTLPVPKQIWPKKPGLDGISTDLSRLDRPLLPSGMVMSLAGDLFINFRWPGILLGGLVLGWALMRFCIAARGAGYGCIVHLSYIMMASCLIQVYRDGLVCLVVHGIANTLPLVAVIVVHWLKTRRVPSLRGVD